MKKHILIVWALALIILTACSQQSENRAPVQSQEKTNIPGISQNIATVMPSAETKPTATPFQSTESVTTEIAEIVPDDNIPDIVIDNEEQANSNKKLYEDDNYLYYWWSNWSYNPAGLIRVNKSEGKTKTMVRDCNGFTVSNGKIYYIDAAKKENNDLYSKIINAFDVETNVSKSIVKMDNGITSLAIYDNQLYFTCEPDLDSNIYGDILYISDIDGSHITEIHDDVYCFCIYQGKVFSMTYGELGHIHEYNVDQPYTWKDIDHNVDENYDVCFNKLVCTEYKKDVFNASNNFIYDITTGDTTELPFVEYYYALAGQYMFFCEYDDNDSTIIKAYDFLDNKEYTLSDISELAKGSRVELNPVKDAIYLCVSVNNRLEMYKLGIRDGAANLKHIISIDYKNF